MSWSRSTSHYVPCHHLKKKKVMWTSLGPANHMQIVAKAHSTSWTSISNAIKLRLKQQCMWFYNCTSIEWDNSDQFIQHQSKLLLEIRCVTYWSPDLRIDWGWVQSQWGFDRLVSSSWVWLFTLFRDKSKPTNQTSRRTPTIWFE